MHASNASWPELLKIKPESQKATLYIPTAPSPAAKTHPKPNHAKATEGL